MRKTKLLFVSLILLLALTPLYSVAAADAIPALTPPIPPNAIDPHCSISSEGIVCHWTAAFGTPSSGVPYGYVTCNGAPVIVTLGGEMKVNAFYSETGQLELLKRHISYSGKLSSPVTGKSVPHLGNAILTIDPLAGTTTITGLYHYTVLPGQGMIFLDAGIVAVNADGTVAFSGGPHDYYEAATQQLCAALS